MRFSMASIAAVLLACAAAPAVAQFKEGDPGGAKLGASHLQKWQAGIVVVAQGGPCKGIIGYAPIPSEWPEQQIKVAQQDVSPGVHVTYQTVADSVRVMVVRMPTVPANQEAKALMTFEITRNVQLLPEEKDRKAFELPDLKELDVSMRRYLTASPKIETRDAKIRKAAKEVGADKEKAWDRVEALYDWARQKVKYKQGGAVKGAVAALREGVGGHEDLACLFIALCRAADIPARTVWVPEFCYAEFYLVDAKGEGHWLPCQPAGARAFGEMPDTRPILQKGDNFQPPYNNRDRQRYLAEYLTGSPAQNGGKPRVQFVRQMVN